MVKFLHDQPAEEDFFGPHSKIADSILDAVCDDTRLRVVGLVGRWGSGKSTVVRQLSRSIATDERCKNYIFFEYDAWLSQNDPPRRAFMESLISFLIERRILKKKTWERRLDILRGRIQESVKTTTPVLTWKSTVYLKTYLALAIGLFLLNKLQLKKFSDGTATLGEQWMAFTAIALLSLAPLAMMAIFAREALIERLPPDKRSVVPRLLNKSIDSQRETTTKEPEPSSIEFRDAFRDIMVEVGGKSKRLLIVLDNLDRLSDEEALGLWSSMRSFFVDRLGQDFVENAPVVLVPVDIGSLTRVFAKTNQDPKNASEIAKSYIDKTFDVTFEVREPAITDWRRYFDESFTATVGDLYGSWDVHQARRMYEAHLIGKPKPITPRTILRMANFVATLAATAVSKIPLPTIVLYALNEDSIQEGVLAWIDGKDYSEFDEAWKLNIAALHFMVERDKAVGPLLKEELSSAIVSNDEAVVEKYVDIHGLGDIIAELARDPPQDQAGRVTIGTLATLASILKEKAASIHGSAHWFDEAQRSISAAFLRFGHHQSGISMLAPLLDYLTGFSNDKAPLLKKAATILASTLSQEKLNDNGITYVADALNVMGGVLQAADISLPAIPIEGDATVTLARQFALQGRLKYPGLIKGPSATKAVQTALANWLQDPLRHSQVPKMVRMLSLNENQKIVVTEEIEKNPLLVTIDQIVRDAEQSAFLPSAIEVMTELLFDAPHAVSIAHDWASENGLTERFNEAVARSDADAVWALIVLGVTSEIYFETTTPQPWPPELTPRDAAQGALLKLEKFSVSERRRLIWAAIGNWKSVLQLLFQLRNQFLASSSSSDFDVPEMFKSYKSTILEGGRAPFLNLLSKSDKADAALDQLAVEDLIQILELPHISPEARSRIVSTIVGQLYAATKDEWSEWIQSGSPLFGHWDEFQKSWPEPLGKRSGIYAALTKTAVLAASDRPLLKRWLRLLPAITATAAHDARVVVLREAAMQPTATEAISFLKVMDPSDAEIRAQKSSWLSLLTKLVGDKEGRAWIDAHETSVRRLVKSFAQGDAKALRKSIDHLSIDKREGRRLWAEKATRNWFS